MRGSSLMRGEGAALLARQAACPGRRDTDGFQPRMGATGTRLQAIEIGADVVAGQVQHPAPEPPVLLDLRLGFHRPSGEFPVRVAGLRYPLHGGLERRVLELEMNAET